MVFINNLYSNKLYYNLIKIFRYRSKVICANKYANKISYPPPLKRDVSVSDLTFWKYLALL